MSTLALKVSLKLSKNKAHGHDNISIGMLKLCGSTICKPLETIFKQALFDSLVRFRCNRRKTKLSLFIKNVTSKILTFTLPFSYSQFIIKFSKDLFLIR